MGFANHPGVHRALPPPYLLWFRHRMSPKASCDQPELGLLEGDWILEALYSSMDSSKAWPRGCISCPDSSLLSLSLCLSLPLCHDINILPVSSARALLSPSWPLQYEQLSSARYFHILGNLCGFLWFPACPWNRWKHLWDCPIPDGTSWGQTAQCTLRKEAPQVAPMREGVACLLFPLPSTTMGITNQFNTH